MTACDFQCESGRCVCRRCGRRVTAPTLPVRATCRGVAATDRLLNQHHGQPPHGPGTELKKLLARVGITSTPDCSCNARARTMDERGSEWCEANIDEIVGWLREEAQKRGLPFVDMAGRVLVRRAIANARREQARAGRPRLHARG